LDNGIPALKAAHDSSFSAKFPYPLDFPKDRADSLQSFSKDITSNLLGGVGYFYGTSIINRKFSYEWDEEEEDSKPTTKEPSGARLSDPKALLTATPSRSFFPRGFYWFAI
jgi:mannosyl-oligosaccharide glucosidase